MNNDIFSRDFLGPENLDGFNFALPQDKISLILEAQIRLKIHDNKMRNKGLMFLLSMTALYFILKFLGVNEHILMQVIVFLTFIGTIPLYKKRVNKWTFHYIHFLLKRNEELLQNNFNQKQLLWKQMIF